MSNPFVFRARRLVHRSGVLQVMLLVALWGTGEKIVRVTGLPVPGGVVGMALLLVLLGRRQLGLGSVLRGAQWMLADMLLFFVPAVVALVNHREWLGLLGFKLLVVIVLGTTGVMGVTAATAELCTRLLSEDRRHA